MAGEMIERVGRALAQADGYAYDPYPYDVWARAAIEAMRDPTAEILQPIAFPMDEDMVAGKTLQREKGTAVVFPKVEIEMAVGQWRCAIDAALKD